ncbi:DNA repair protein RAD5B [Dendrobium catenatum]|uniref:SWI/SNF-related matrix-associated actin-dependent regulator of chromatin subfamily A member 3-like 3 n=1 Tax=Dendrobium catenatum TaxID=906689 RepID=A0A2I0WH41_9ASPA|nr:DNA repair protein RAD5B [Dendrobium catenatum]PKU74958.1 Putative SWI/SNF-related matrix-associated actin-dependent regulator of chromatin subfamily A member 3-like 3 [Dendrobium catenatum]
MGFETPPDPSILLADEIRSIRLVLGNEIPVVEILQALAMAGNNTDRAINFLLDAPRPVYKSELIKEKNASGRPEFELKALKEESITHELENAFIQPCRESATVDMENRIRKAEPAIGSYEDAILVPDDKINEEPDRVSGVKKVEAMDFDQYQGPVEKKDTSEESCDNFSMVTTAHYSPRLNARPIRAFPPKSLTKPVSNRSTQVPSNPDPAEMAEFPEEPSWFLVARSYVTGLATTRGSGKLEPSEIVYFNFPKISDGKLYGRRWVSSKAAAATSEIVRFSTKRSGELGRLPPEWSQCLIPLVHSSKVKVRGRCAIAPDELCLMKEIMLYVSFYIHSSVFTEGDKSSWKLEATTPNSALHPLHNLFFLLKMKPFKEADFTPEELDGRKRSLNLVDQESEQIEGLAKRRKGDTTFIEQSNDEQAISEASLNKLVGTAEMYNLQEAKPPRTLLSNLWSYQKQALYWMSELEKGIDVEQAAKTLHPCWSAYKICDKRAPAVYLNVFSGEVTTQFPSATLMARGGILADAMGLGKTVMTIALILANPSRAAPDDEDTDVEAWNESARNLNKGSPSLKGGTLIVCPMALLGQWKDELEAHSKPGSISVFVHYGGEKCSDLREISKYHVVLTTYGVLTSAYKTGSEKKSIFHNIRWYRVVLDEAHTIKCSKSNVAQSAFALTSHCRWCLTGTPLQNSLADLYSLLCFLHVQPWCNWSWWHKLIQKPYENGDERGLRLVKAILRPLMLRRTKETKDKEGKPILVLPPAQVQVVECEQSKEERDFYEALFWKSKIKFDQFVAEGRVLHNYASILELLLRLRQCCNHPYLVMSRGNNQQNADLNSLAQRFLEVSHYNPGGSTQCPVPAPSYVEEVVEGIKRGEVSECPICLESASDDPVFTPCAHRMCRECLLRSWKTPTAGPCPICRRVLTKAELIMCPTESPFEVDINKNWKESSKVKELMNCLVKIRCSGMGEKSIVFSQWTSFLDLLEICFNREGIQFLRFDGQLSQKNRERVLKEFAQSNDKKVLLMSLKAGGVGLNLTAASNVFLMDPWWNPAVEEQAIMRIHRIGQKRQVKVRRFIVKDTVEDRMQQVQARKQRMIAGALTDEEVRSARIEELKMLFR